MIVTDIKSRILLAAQSGLKFTPQGMADLMTVDILAANKACLELHRGGLIELLEPPCWYGIQASIDAINARLRVEKWDMVKRMVGSGLIFSN